MDNELLKAQKELLSSSFSHAMAYTNTVVLGGYAAFFAIWNFTKPQLSNGQILLSALLMSVSLMSFVAFEIYGMVFRSKSILGLARAVSNPQQFVLLLQEHKENEQSKAIVYGRVWVAALAVSVFTGFGAAFILIWAFISELFKLYA
ncbi:MAG: hypothetical protein ABW170_13325 [Candidatus Thiodiazotropha sp. L084R]